jgi:hypothetical protein
MAGRAERFADRAAQAQREQAIAIQHFQQLLGNVIPGRSVSDNETHIGSLAPVAPGTGGGFALQLVSPQILDFVMVIVNGLDVSTALPLRVQLVNDRGRVLRAGRIDTLDANGGAEVYHQFRTQDLGGFATVNVVDASGGVILTGTVDQSG